MATATKVSLAPKAIGVKTLPTDNLVPNPHNPRMLFDKDPMNVLRESVQKVGILVPLTVYKDKAKNQYVILDGQRRWICAKDVGLPTVPVNEVSEPTLSQNIIIMFQIHRFREDWELMPTALKLEVLMKELQETNDKKLSTLTGLDQAVVIRCKKLLSYEKEFQDLMLDPDPSKRLKTDFFIELYAILIDRYVNKMDWFSKNKFIRRMLEKYRRKGGGIKSVTDFRIMKQHISNAVKAKKIGTITKRLKEFTDDDSLSLDYLEVKSAEISHTIKTMLKDTEHLRGFLQNIDIADYYGEEKLWKELQDLMKLIRTKLLEAGRRLT